jgi:hypothetical protein
MDEVKRQAKERQAKDQKQVENFMAIRELERKMKEKA